MKVLFVLRTDGFLRNFEGAIREMRRRGHYVTVAVELDIRKRGNPLVAELRDEGVAFKRAPSRLYNARHQTAVQARLGLDYLRYLDDRYADKDKLRERAAAAAPALVRLLANAPGGRTSRGRERIGHGLAAFDAASPVSPEVQSFLAANRPDVLLISPLVELGAPQTDWIRAARELGVPSVLGVASWDNLTVKGKLREWPDRVLVWNDAQVGEASEIHGLPADRVIATGAHSYDHWFRWRPSRDREQFCAEAGLRGDRPILLYLCSSPFIAPGEAQFVLDWIAALRDSREPELREAGVLVRPHPQHAAQWAGVSLDGLDNAVLFPPAGADPVERSSRSDFFDSIYHCRAVVGVNTSAQIEASVVGRDVLTVLDPRFASTQGGTLHFEHIARADGGLLRVGRDMAEHHEQLAACLRGENDGAVRRERFLSAFVRPHALDEPAAPRFVDALESVAPLSGPPAPAAPAALRRLGYVWRFVPWRPIVMVLSNRERARVARRLVQAREIAKGLAPPTPPRTVGALREPLPAPTTTNERADVTARA